MPSTPKCVSTTSSSPRKTRIRLKKGQEFTANLNPVSLEVIAQAKLEPSLANAPIGGRYQFERLGYFCVDSDSRPGSLVFNRTVALKDTWAKVEKKIGMPSTRSMSIT